MAGQAAFDDERGPRCVADLVFDVGAHLGEDTAYYLKLGFRVVAVEAHPDLAGSIRRRFATQIAGGRLTLVEAAIADEPGEIVFHVCDSSSVFGTTHQDLAERNARHGHRSHAVDVQTVRMEELFQQHGVPHYLKVDIEGSDMLAIEALAGLEARPSFVSVEAGIGDRHFLVGQFDTLERIGYRRFKVVRQGRHGRFDDPKVGGKAIDHAFDIHSSGPFGDQLPGRWLTREQALRQYACWAMYARILDPDRPLGKVLSKLPLVRRLPLRLPWFDTHARR